MTFDILFKDIETRFRHCKGEERYLEIRRLLENVDSSLFLTVKAHCTTQVFAKDFVPYGMTFVSLCFAINSMFINKMLDDVIILLINGILSIFSLLCILHSLHKMMKFTPKHKYVISIIEDIEKERDWTGEAGAALEDIKHKKQL
jgi:hypothetical protein